MRKRSPRAGEALRIVIVLAFLFLAVPMLFVSLGFLGWRTSAARAEQLQQARQAESRVIAQLAAERARQNVQTVEVRAAQEAAEQARQAAEEARRDIELDAGGAGQRLRPTTETVWQNEVIETRRPITDPETGQIQYEKVQVPTFVPRTVTRYQATVTRSPLDPAVARIIGELQALEAQDPAYARKLEELKTRLGLEFDSMHDAQANEIAETEKRLEALKTLHQQRGENKDKIVQRRIDELLGRSDALRWEIGSPPIIFSNPAAMLPPSTETFGLPGADVTAPAQPQWQPSYVAPIPILPQPITPPGVTIPAPPRVPPVPAAPGAPAPHTPRSEDLAPLVTRVEESIVTESEAPATATTSAPPTIGQLSDLARRVAAGELELSRTRRERESVRRVLADMRKQIEQDETSASLRQLFGAKSRELDHLEDKLGQLQRESALNLLEVKTIREALYRGVAFAEAQLMATQRGYEESRERFEQGVAKSETVNRAEMELNLARKQLEEARTSLEYLLNSLRLLTKEDDGEVGSSAAEDPAEIADEVEVEADLEPDVEAEAIDSQVEEDASASAAVETDKTDVETESP